MYLLDFFGERMNLPRERDGGDDGNYPWLHNVGQHFDRWKPGYRHAGTEDEMNAFGMRDNGDLFRSDQSRPVVW